jgi:hypothetical protein
MENATLLAIGGVFQDVAGERSAGLALAGCNNTGTLLRLPNGLKWAVTLQKPHIGIPFLS